MKLQARANTQYAALDDGTAGEGLAIFFSQSATDVNRWRIDVHAKLDTGAELLVGTFYISPPITTTPIGPLTRQVAAAVCPGAITWSVYATAFGNDGGTPATETADITLISSKCCTAPVGVTRVGERYGYHAGVVGGVLATVTPLPGQIVTRVSATATAAGAVALAGGQTIVVPNGTSVALEPKAPIVLGIQFLNVDYVIEYLESA